jgi:hypothetical protein
MIQWDSRGLGFMVQGLGRRHDSMGEYGLEGLGMGLTAWLLVWANTRSCYQSQTPNPDFYSPRAYMKARDANGADPKPQTPSPKP